MTYIKIVNDEQIYRVNLKLLDKFKESKIYTYLSTDTTESSDFMSKSSDNSILYLDLNNQSLEHIINYIRGYKLNYKNINILL